MVSSPELGSYLVAARPLEPGALVLDEEVAVLGPVTAPEPAPLCPGCYYPTTGYRCGACGVQLCGPACEAAASSPHRAECGTLARYGAAAGADITRFITPLRFLLLRTSDPARCEHHQ